MIRQFVHINSAKKKQFYSFRKTSVKCKNVKMGLKIFISILLIGSNLYGSFGQYEFLGCNYFLQNDTYYGCRMEIYNPTGLKNFTAVEGIHLSEKTDEDVKYITRDRVVSMPNYPSIILRKFRNTEKLELTNSIFERIDDNAFQFCKNLLHLDFGFNKFKRMEDNLFKNCKDLTYLSLLRNEISDISEYAFSNLTSLSVLILSHNPIESFSKNIFKPLTSLVRLDADYMKLKVLHSNSFGGHRYFTTFSLVGNLINAFDEAIIDITAINFLDVRANVCVNAQLKDATILRSALRSSLSTCIRNYNTLTSNVLK